jgi:heat shock protein HslJ
MPDLVEITKSRVAPEAVPQLAKYSELSPSETRTALDAVVPALVHGFASSGATSAGATQLSQFAKDQQGVTSLTEHLTSEAASTRLSTSGSKILPAVFGDNLGRTIDCVATTTGITYNSAAALMHLVAPLVMGTLGGEARRLSLDGKGMTNFLGDQRSSTVEAMPQELSGCLGLQRRQVAAAAPVAATEVGRARAAVATPVRAEETVRTEPVRATAQPLYTERATLARPRAKIPGWLWLLPILALLGVGAWLLLVNRPALPTVSAPAVAVPTVAVGAPTISAPGATAPTVVPPGAAAPAAGAVPGALAGTVWMWQRLQRPNTADVRPANPRDYTLLFAVPGDGRHGDIDYKSDCNAGRGTYQQDGGSVAFDATGVPRAACGSGSLSTEFLSRLGDVSTYQVRDGKLYLNLKDNAGTLEFSPAPAQ